MSPKLANRSPKSHVLSADEWFKLYSGEKVSDALKYSQGRARARQLIKLLRDHGISKARAQGMSAPEISKLFDRSVATLSSQYGIYDKKPSKKKQVPVDVLQQLGKVEMNRKRISELQRRLYYLRNKAIRESVAKGMPKEKVAKKAKLGMARVSAIAEGLADGRVIRNAKNRKLANEQMLLEAKKKKLERDPIEKTLKALTKEGYMKRLTETGIVIPTHKCVELVEARLAFLEVQMTRIRGREFDTSISLTIKQSDAFIRGSLENERAALRPLMQGRLGREGIEKFWGYLQKIVRKGPGYVEAELREIPNLGNRRSKEY